MLAILVLLTTLIAPLTMGSTAQEIESSDQETQSSSWSPPRTVYIEETGHTLDQLFLDLWRNAGGASAFGYPITP